MTEMDGKSSLATIFRRCRREKKISRSPSMFEEEQKGFSLLFSHYLGKTHTHSLNILIADTCSLSIMIMSMVACEQIPETYHPIKLHRLETSARMNAEQRWTMSWLYQISSKFHREFPWGDERDRFVHGSRAIVNASCRSDRTTIGSEGPELVFHSTDESIGKGETKWKMIEWS